MSVLANTRREAGYTIDQASKELKLPMGYLSQVENGKRSVDPERAEQIASLYGKQVSDIFLPSRYSVRIV